MTDKLCTAAMLLGGLGLAACQPPSSTDPLSASNPTQSPVVIVQGCGYDDGGFGAPVRHFGNPTPFSENPFNRCWPE